MQIKNIEDDDDQIEHNFRPKFESQLNELGNMLGEQNGFNKNVNNKNYNINDKANFDYGN